MRILSSEGRTICGDIRIEFNGRALSTVVIDQHYKVKHPEISDDLILEILILKISGKFFVPEGTADAEGFLYYRAEPVHYENQPYRLILVTHATENFLGVINAFRVEKKK